MNFKLLPFLFSLAVLAVSCTDEPDDKPVSPDTLVRSAGVYVMNEGLLNGNNASITRFAFSDSTLATDIFLQQNGRGLGDTGSDLAIYGGKMYAVVNMSSQVEVMDARTCKALSKFRFSMEIYPASQGKLLSMAIRLLSAILTEPSQSLILLR